MLNARMRVTLKPACHGSSRGSGFSVNSGSLETPCLSVCDKPCIGKRCCRQLRGPLLVSEMGLPSGNFIVKVPYCRVTAYVSAKQKKKKKKVLPHNLRFVCRTPLLYVVNPTTSLPCADDRARTQPRLQADHRPCPWVRRLEREVPVLAICTHGGAPLHPPT